MKQSEHTEIPLLLIAMVLATVTGSGATQHAGEGYTLTCTVSGGETTATTTYQWRRNNSPLSGETSATLSFTPLRQTTLSSNGQYVCEAMRSGRTLRSGGFTITVIGKFIYSVINISANHSQYINSTNTDTCRNT